MAPTILGTDSAHSSATTVDHLDLTLPGGISAGDVGLLVASTANTSRTGVAPTGGAAGTWTMVGGTHLSTTGVRAWLYRRTMDGSEDGATVSPFLNSTAVMRAGLIVLAGVDASTEVIASGSDTSDDTTLATVAITPAVVDSILVSLTAMRYSTTGTISVTTDPTGFTERIDIGVDNSGIPQGIYVATKQLTGGGLQSSVSGTFGVSAREHSWMVALGPAAAPQDPTIFGWRAA